MLIFEHSNNGENSRDFRKNQISCGMQRFSTVDKRKSNCHSEALNKLEQGHGHEPSQRQYETVAPNFLENAEKTSNQQSQTDSLSIEARKIFEKILCGPNSSEFCQFMFIFVSGYGKLDFDNDV